VAGPISSDAGSTLRRGRGLCRANRRRRMSTAKQASVQAIVTTPTDRSIHKHCSPTCSSSVAMHAPQGRDHDRRCAITLPSGIGRAD
jgi:hypothetical protein